MTKILMELDVPDELAEKAKKHGLLSPEALLELIANSVADYPDEPALPEGYPPGFDPRLVGAASPKLFGKGRVIGDLDEPLDVVWKACVDDYDHGEDHGD